MLHLVHTVQMEPAGIGRWPGEVIRIPSSIGHARVNQSSTNPQKDTHL